MGSDLDIDTTAAKTYGKSTGADHVPSLGYNGEYSNVPVFAFDEQRLAHEVFRLSVGDSIRFRADTAHAYRNAVNHDVLLSMLIYDAG